MYQFMDFVIPFVIVLMIFVFIFSLITMNRTNNGFNLVHFYFTIVSIVSIIGMVVAYGIAGYNTLMLNLVSDQEYLQARESWEVQDCTYRKYDIEYPTPKTPDNGAIAPVQVQKPDPEEITQCEKEAAERSINRRNYNAKEAIIGGLVRGTLFLLLFLTHYPRMVRKPIPVKKTVKKDTSKKKSAKKS